MKQTFDIDTDDTPDVVNRIASVLRRCDLNIDSLSVARTGRQSHITLVVDSDAKGARYVEAGIGKLRAVRRVRNLTNEHMVGRSTMLIKVEVNETSLADVLQRLRQSAMRVISVGQERVVVELTADDDVIERTLPALQSLPILEMTRSGRTVMTLG
jgi:acetolactate synthase-1/3 small subunit